MNKSNLLLLGIILVLIAAFSALQHFFSVNFMKMALLAGGVALLMLYQGKRKMWSLVLGMYLLYWGLIAVLQGVLPDHVFTTLTGAMFFIVPGLIFFLRYLKKNGGGMIYPASFLLWFGVFIILTQFPPLVRLGFPLFLVCAGGSFLFIYLVGKRSAHRGVLYTGVCLLGLGGAVWLTHLPVFGMGSALLAGLGIVIILIAAGKRKKADKPDEDYFDNEGSK
ncbi:MAG: hypothetical protein FWF44_06215 [Defluviitaleaceae bacterium]|nr:hypothetical protein [Defluviitaleaceae bacterium]